MEAITLTKERAGSLSPANERDSFFFVFVPAPPRVSEGNKKEGPEKEKGGEKERERRQQYLLYWGEEEQSRRAHPGMLENRFVLKGGNGPKTGAK